jgi:hypothetical protein
MPRGNKRRVPQSSPQKTTPSTCEDKRMQRCPGPLPNRPRGAPPGMNPDRMFLIAKRFGLVRRCADRWRQACAAPHPRRYLGRSQATSRDAVLRSPPSSTPALDIGASSWESQINRYDYLRGPKQIDEKLMCSETPTAGTLPAIYASEAWSCDLNVEGLKVKSNPMGPTYMN